jgi:hypothetical protein
MWSCLLVVWLLVLMTCTDQRALDPWNIYIKASETNNVCVCARRQLVDAENHKTIQGGVIDQDEVGVKNRLERITKFLGEYSCSYLQESAADMHRSSASQFAEPHRAEKSLLLFANLNDQRLYKLFKAMSATTTDIEGLVKTRVRIKLSETWKPTAYRV